MPTRTFKLRYKQRLSLGRKEYNRQNYDVTKALVAMQTKPLRINQTTTAPVIGGGDSLLGKLHWLLENEGDKTASGLAERLNMDVRKVAVACSKLNGLGRATQSGERGALVFHALKREVTA